MLVALESIVIKRKCTNIFSLVIEAMNKNNEIMVKGYGSPQCYTNQDWRLLLQSLNQDWRLSQQSSRRPTTPSIWNIKIQKIQKTSENIMVNILFNLSTTMCGTFIHDENLMPHPLNFKSILLDEEWLNNNKQRK
jgi:hypothetical protein